jgi:hypothetical protein
MKRRLARTLVALAGCLAILGTTAVSAQAANGTFTYRLQAGDVFKLVNPADNVCRKITHFGQTTIRAINHTDRTAYMYMTQNCTGSSVPVRAGVDTEDFDPSSSVLFAP